MSPASNSLSHIASSFNATLLFSCCVIAISQINFGFDQGVFSSTQAMKAFDRQFGEYNASTKAYAIAPWFLSLLNSLPYAGFAFGLVSGTYISRHYGRRACMFVMCIWALIGATLVVSAKDRAQLVVGRVIAYIYIGSELAVVPIFQSELVPAKVRGFVVGTYQLSLTLGQLCASLICRRTSTFHGNASWRLPFGLLYIIPTILLILLWFVPESPRWYLIQGRSDEALKSLQSLRRGRFAEEDIQIEWQELQTSTIVTIDRGRFIEVFQGVNLGRTLITVGTNIFLQITGQNFVSNYGTIFIASLKTINPFTMSVINSVINIVVILAAMLMADKVGRKPLLIVGAIIQTGALFSMGGLGISATPTLAARKGITAMVSVFGTGYSIGWAPLAHVIAAEIPSVRLRDYTYGLASLVNILIQFAVSFSIPYLLYAPYADLGSKVGFIFGSFAACAILFAWLVIPELKGKTLEEIDDYFRGEESVNQQTQYDKA